MRIDRLAYELMEGFLIVTLIYMVLAGLLVPVAAGTAGGTEFNLASVWMPTTMYGSVGVYVAPFNVSQPGLVTVNNFYVVDQQGHPYYSYLFSTNPPLAIWADGSTASKTYTLFYGGGNPYSDYIATPGGSVPLLPAYDDFDYDSGLWIYSGSHAIQNSLDYLQGAMYLNKSYTPGVLSLWLIRFGKAGTMIQLYSNTTYKGWVFLRLTSTNFGAWNNIIDGNDIYFLGQDGQPLYYDILYFNKTAERADILVDVELSPGLNTIYMLYGQQNPYTQYRVTPSTPVPVIDITPPPTTATGTHTLIKTGATQETITLNTTAVITPGAIIAPHLYDWYFDGVDDYIEVPNTFSLQFYNYTVFVSRFMPLHDTDTVLVRCSNSGNTIYLSYSSGYTYAGIHDSGGWLQKAISTAQENEWVSTAFEYIANNETGYRLYQDGELKAVYNMTGRYNLAGTTSPIYIAVNIWNPTYFKEYVSYTIIYSDTINHKILSDTDIENIMNNHIINTSGQALFLDPTFYNGTTYIDLSPYGNDGVPYGGVSRVPADQKWLWVVLGGRGDGFVHLDWFPVGSIVKFYNATDGSLVAVVRVVSPSRDVPVALPPGNYTVEATIPWTTGLYRGVAAGVTAYPVGNNTAYRLSNGAILYVEYVGNGEMLAWIGGRPLHGLGGYIVAPDPLGREAVFRLYDGFHAASRPIYPVQVSPVVLTANIELNGSLADIVPENDLSGLRVTYWTWNLTSYTNNTVWVHGLPLQAVLTITDETTGQPVLVDTVPPTPNGTLVQPGPGNYTVTITMPPPGYIVAVQAQNQYIGPGTLIAPHIYQWYLDDDRRVWKPPYIELTTTTNITTQTTIAPHLYNAYFYNESSSVIDFGGNGLDFSTLGIMTGIILEKNDAAILGKGFVGLGANAFSIYVSSTSVLYGETNTINGVVSTSIGPISLNKYYDIYFTYNGTNQTIGILGVGNTTNTQSGDILNPYAQPIRLGTPLANPHYTHLLGYMSYAIIYNASLTTDQLSLWQKHIVVQNNYSIMFFDPTFFNGTYYIDLFGNLVGTPSYVQRVLAGDPWLWVVVGSGGSGVRLAWFPLYSVVDFINATSGALVKSVVVDNRTSLTSSGLVEEQYVSLPPGTYIVHAYIAYGLENGTWDKISVTTNTLPITVRYPGPSPVPNFSLPVVLTAENFTGWSTINASNIYFTDADGRPLYYWVEELDTVDKKAVIWVNITLTNTTIYMHYGGSNPYASYDDPSRVFLVYDDFNWTASLSGTSSGTVYVGNGWYLYSSASDNAWSVSVSDGLATISAKDTVSGNGPAATYLFYNGTPLNTPVAIVFNASCVNWGGVGSGSYYRSYNLGMGYPGTSHAVLTANENGRLLSTGNPAGSSSTADLGILNVALFYKYRILVNNSVAEIYYYNTTTGNWVFWGSKTDYLPNTTMYPQFEVAAWTGYGPFYLKISYVYVYKYIANYTVAPVEYSVVLENITYRVVTPIDYYYHYTVVFSLFVNGTVTLEYPATSGAPVTVLVNGTTPTYTYGKTGTAYQVNVTLTIGTYNLTVVTRAWRTVTGEQLVYKGSQIYYHYNLTAVSRFTFLKASTNAWNIIALHTSIGYFGIQFIYQQSYTFNTGVHNSTNVYYLWPPNNIISYLGTYTLITGHYLNTTTNTWWVYGVLYNSTYTYNLAKDSNIIGDPITNGTDNIEIERADSPHHLYLSFVVLYADDKPVFLGDPGFYNGTGYVDPLSGFYAVSTSNTSDTLYMPRAPDPWPRLWIFNSVYGDGKVHLRFFPPGTRLVLSQGGVVKYVINIPGNITWPYTVNDTTADIAAGTYNITAYIPVYPVTPAYNLTYAPEALQSPDGWGGAFTGSSIQYPGQYYMVSPNTTTTITLPVETPIILDTRATPSGWVLGLAPVNGSTPYLVAYSNGTTVTLTYNGTTATTSQPPVTTQYLYAALLLLPNGTVDLLLGNGSYPDIYRGAHIVLSLNATGTQYPGPLYPLVGVLGGDQTVTYDYLRIYNETTDTTVALENTTLTPVEQEAPDIGPGNYTEGLSWTEHVKLDTTGLYIVVPGHTWVEITYNLEPEPVWGLGQAMAYTGTNKIEALLNGTVPAGEALVTGLNDTLVLSWNATTETLVVGVIDPGGLYSQLLSIQVNDTLYGPPTVIATPGETPQWIPSWIHGNTSYAYNTVFSMAQTIVPVSAGGIAMYRLGYTATAGNTTYEFGYGINGTQTFIYLEVNGTIEKQIGLGIAHTPLIAGIGYDYDNNTGTLLVYGMSIWETPEHETLYTWKYMAVTVPDNITAAQPFARAINGTLIIDRYGLVIGTTMEKVVEGDIKLEIAGPYPVGGMVKYVTITQPITVELAGGQVIVYPSPKAGHTILLKGFKGWTLDLALYGTSVTDTLISSDDYGLDFPPGFSAVIVADISARKISIVSAQSPPNTGNKIGSIGEKINIPQPPLAPPPPPVVPGAGQIINMTVLVAGIIGASIIGSRLSGNIYDGVTIAGLAATVILVALGMYSYAGIAVMIAIASQAIKKALQS